MQDREKLRKLLDLIEELLKEEGNEWLIDELLNKIEKISPIDKVARTSVIQRINEYCIEQNIKKQAEDFYHDFKVNELKSQLIDDFKKMEHQKRRDDFEGFSMCLYQQIENIVNYLFEKYIYYRWDTIKDKKVIYNKSFRDLSIYKGKDKFPNSDREKFKAVVSFFYLGEEATSQAPFIALDNIFPYVKDARNMNHRGSSLYPKQEERIQEMTQMKTRFILKFYGFLQDFVSGINDNLKEEGNKNQSSKKKNKKGPENDDKNIAALQKAKKNIKNKNS